MTRTFASAALAMAFATAFTPSVYAQAPATEKKEEPKVAAPQKDPKAEAYETFVKDMKRIEGNMPLYQRKKELFLEIPEERLGQLFLIQAALHSGLDGAFMHAGMPVGGNTVDTFKWVRNEETLMLVRPNIQYRYDKDDAYSAGAARSFPEATLGTFPIVQQDPVRKRLLINVTQFFYGDTFRLSEMVMGSLGGPYQAERDKSGVEYAKGFDDSTVVRMKLQYFSPRGSQQNPLAVLMGLQDPNTLEDDRSAPLQVTYRMWYRRDDGYVARLSDPRVGYFTESFFSVGRFLNADRTERYINRFNLQKKDPKAATSEPVKPIAWTIDPSIPAEFRPAVKEGVLRWNKAFDAMGYKNAVVVEDAPKGEDYDHADGRRNVIRLLVGPGAPFAAISLFRTDPLSGQILNASITLDGNVIRDLQEEHSRNMASMANASQRATQVLRRDASRRENDDFFLFASPAERTRLAAAEQLRKYGWAHQSCEHGNQLKREADLMWYAVAASPNPAVNRTEYIKRYLADCVSHEVGHCLGLRHNFAGSTALTTAQLGDDKVTESEGVSASVMDYNPPNVMAVLRGKGTFYANTIGRYDMWAIKYGYADFGAKTPANEKFQLSQIARLSGQSGHAYLTDDDADGVNPYAVRLDGAKDPLNYSERVLLSMRRATDYAVKNLPKPGESYSKRTNVILNALLRSVREGRNAARFVGGVATSKNFRGDVGEQPTIKPISPAQQRQAVSLITTHFFAPDAFRLPPNVLQTLSFDENEEGGWTAPMRDIVGGQQQSLFALMLAAGTTDRIAENALKQPGGYTLDEHYRTVLNAVFAEVGTGANVTPLRRDLQRFALNGLISQAAAPQGSVNEDVRILAAQNLRGLQARIKTRLAKPEKLDAMTKLHLRDSQESIGRFFAREIAAAR
ncbi:MAG: zinc-dependent metalloprotease [Fimbriimonas sp.]